MKRLMSSFLFVTVSSLGCAGAELNTPTNLPRPRLVGVSATQLSVGSPLEFLGGDFLTKDGHTEIHFVGKYTMTNGQVEDVDLRFQPHFDDGTKLTWAYMGPLNVPFCKSGDQLGTFDGQVSAVNVGDQGGTVESEPLPATIEIKPSLIVTDFQPLGAQCGHAVRRLLGGYPYKIKVQAVGFEPVNFSYLIARVGQSNVATVIRHAATGSTDTFGDNNELVMPAVDDSEPFSVARVEISSLDKNGVQHTMPLLFGLHRAMEYINSQSDMVVAEIGNPVPLSACQGGGNVGGNTVTYTFTTDETKMRSWTLNWDQQWLTSHTTDVGHQTTNANSTNVSITNGSSSGSNWSAGGQAGGALGFLFGAVNGEYGQNSETNHSRTVGRDYSHSDTESWSLSTTLSHSLSMGGSDFWSVSESQSVSRTLQGLIPPSEFGVFYNQTTRLMLPGVLINFDLCGEPAQVAETSFSDFKWSWDLAQGGQCPPLPKSSLPPGQCLIAPCTGDL